MDEPNVEDCAACGKPIYTDVVNFIVRAGGVYHFACALPPDPDFPYKQFLP
jgi:hypothetical protein